MNDDFFFKNFHRMKLIGFLFFYKNNFAKRPFSQNFEKFKVRQCLYTENKSLKDLLKNKDTWKNIIYIEQREISKAAPAHLI